MDMDWTRVQQVNLPAFQRILNSYVKIGIPITARPHLPIAISEEIHGDGEHGIVEALCCSMMWETDLCSQGLGHVWNTIEMKYGLDVMSLYNDLREILYLEKEEIQIEDQITQTVGKITSTMYDMIEVHGFSQSTIIGKDPCEINFLDMHTELQLQIGDALNNLEMVTDTVIQIITIWKHSKRYEHTWEWSNCPKILNWLDSVFTHCLTLWDILKPLEFSHPQSVIWHLEKTERLLSRVLNSGFFQELHPDRFLKKRTIIKMKYRHIMGKQLLVQSGNAVISLVNKEQANSLLMNPDDHFRTELNCLSGVELKKNKATVTRTDDQGGQLTINFPKLQILLIRRANGKGNVAESVKDQKFCFLCEMLVDLRPNLKIKIWTLSQPLICGSNVSQKTRSLGTIAWDNALCDLNRKTLDVSKEIPWTTLLIELERVHSSIVNIPLSEINKKYLRSRLSRAEDGNDMVSFKAFCVEKLPGTDFTFWEWFIEGLKFGQTYFLDLWRDSYVTGFVGRDDAHELIGECQPGTIMIRLSESIRTALEITWKHRDGVVYSTGPITKDILVWKKLPETILEIQSKLNLSQFYPERCIQELSMYLEDHDQCVPSKPSRIMRGYIQLHLVPDILNF